MNIVAINTNKKICLGNLSLIINLDNTYPPNPVTLYPILIDIGSITIGADEDSDLVFYPGEFNVKLHFTDSINTIMGYYRFIHQQIKSAPRPVYVYLNSELIWQGYIDDDAEKLVLDEKNKTIEFCFIEQMTRLKNINPKTNPFGYPDLNGRKKIVDILFDIITNGNTYDSFVQSINSQSTLEGFSVVNGQWQLYQFQAFMARLNYYFGTNSNYNNLLQLLKSIAVNYGLIIYVGLDRTLHLIPRFIEYNNVQQITKDDLITHPKYKIINKINGLKVKLWNGNFPKNDYNYYIYELGNYNPEDEFSEELIIDQPCGTFPGSNNSNIEISDLNNYYWLEEDNIRYRKIDGTYSNFQALYYIIADMVFNEIKYPRLKCEIEVTGFYDKWNPSKYFSFENNSVIFRATKFVYDIALNKTKIILKEVGNLPDIPSGTNIRLTEDSYYRLLEDNSLRLI